MTSSYYKNGHYICDCISSHIFITDGIQCLTENTLITGIYLLTAFLADSIIIVFLFILA